MYFETWIICSLSFISLLWSPSDLKRQSTCRLSLLEWMIWNVGIKCRTKFFFFETFSIWVNLWFIVEFLISRGEIFYTLVILLSLLGSAVPKMSFSSRSWNLVLGHSVYSNLPSLAVKMLVGLLKTQCAAVTIQLLLMSVPPQAYLPFL